MARKSLIEREKKKMKLVAKHADKRAALKEEQKNREPSDYVQNFSHVDIDIDHDYCKIDLEGLYKGNLPQKQNLGKPYLKGLSDESEEFSCYDPETEKIIMHFIFP